MKKFNMRILGADWLEKAAKRKAKPCVICDHPTKERHGKDYVCGYHEEHSLACREVYEQRLAVNLKVWPGIDDDEQTVNDNPHLYLSERDFYSNYKTYIRSNEWQIKAYYAKRKAGYKCHDCGKVGSVTTLDAHHLTYERLYKELLQDVIALCRKCHNKRHELA